MTTTTTPTDTDADPTTTTGPASETAGGPPLQRHTGVRIAVAVLAAAALVGGGYAVGAATYSDGESKISGTPAPYSAAFDHDSAGTGYGQGAAAAASAGAKVGEVTGPFILSTAVPMGGRIVDALPADKRTPDNDKVAATALPAGHVLAAGGTDVADPVDGAVFSVSVRADQYPAVPALRYGRPVVIIGAATDNYRGQLVGVQPTADGAAILTLTADSARAVTDTLAHADTIHITSQS